MGYILHLFHTDVRARVEAGEGFEDFEHPALDKYAVEDFIEGSKSYEFISESTSRISNL